VFKQIIFEKAHVLGLRRCVNLTFLCALSNEKQSFSKTAFFQEILTKYQEFGIFIIRSLYEFRSVETPVKKAEIFGNKSPIERWETLGKGREQIIGDADYLCEFQVN